MNQILKNKGLRFKETEYDKVKLYVAAVIFFKKLKILI